MRIDAPVRRRITLRPTALIDVIFLLVLFFLLSSIFLRYAEIPILADTGVASSEDDPPSVILSIGDAANVRVNGIRTTIEGLSAVIRKIDPPFGTTAVVGARGGTVQNLIDVSDALRRAGLSVLLLER